MLLTVLTMKLTGYKCF